MTWNCEPRYPSFKLSWSGCFVTAAGEEAKTPVTVDSTFPTIGAGHRPLSLVFYIRRCSIKSCHLETLVWPENSVLLCLENKYFFFSSLLIAAFCKTSLQLRTEMVLWTGTVWCPGRTAQCCLPLALYILCLLPVSPLYGFIKIF